MILSVIVPLYNEEKTVIKVIQKVLEVKYPAFVHFVEIVIVDDCSYDNSFSIVEQQFSSNNNIKVVRHQKNMGKGAAVRTGISVSSGDVILIQDSDTELSPDDIPSMLVAMNSLGVQFVNGSRYLPGLNRPLYSYKRYLANKFFTFLTSVLIDVKLTDMACGYKLFSKELYNKITLKENRFGFEAELLIKALRVKRNNIAEVPVQYFPRNKGEGKKLGNFDGFKILSTVIKYGLFRMK